MRHFDSAIRRTTKSVLLELLLLSVVCAAGMAQTTNTGTVLGIVTDPSGAVVPGAEIKLIDSATGEARDTATNETGRYTFVGVKPGSYSMTATSSGFQQSVVSSVLVQVAKSVTINFTLKIGQTNEQVIVTDTAGAELQTLDAAVGNAIGGDTLMLLPQQQRNVTSLLLLQPAAMPQQGPNQSSALGGQVAGARSDQNLFLLDGGNVTGATSGNSDYWNNYNGTVEGPIPTPVESIEEFKVVTNNQTASFSGSSGGQVMLVTKRGSNVFHGSAYEFLQNSDLNANTWDRNRLHTPNPQSKDNRFGASLGGYLPKLPESAKTYFYFNYEGRRLSRAVQERRTVPTDTLKQGILRFRDSSGNIVSYNLATSRLCGSAGNSVCDPRGLGLNPLVGQIWNQFMPSGNDPTGGDGLNTIGFSAPINLPINNDFAVFRLDHAFGPRWQFMASYRWFREAQAQDRQFDIGGLAPGDVKGVPKSAASVPRQPRYVVLGLTGALPSNATNELHFSYMRDYWSWDTAGATPQVPGTSAALEMGGETADPLIPMQVYVQSIRTRTWNSHHYDWSDSFSKLKGTHLIQIGGAVSRSLVQFLRGDGQISILQPVYVITQTSGLNIPTANRPPTCSGSLTSNCLPSSQINNWNNLYASVLGLVDSAQVLRTRDASLNLNPLGTSILSNTTFMNYTIYAADSWRVVPTLTLNYGVNWSTGMPALENSGKLSMAVDAAGMVIDPNQYLKLRQQAALQGQVYNPTLEFAPIGATDRKYPYNPRYDTLAPRLAVAWNPNFSGGWAAKVFGHNATVIRAGYGRVYDRMNGVQSVIDIQQGYGFTVNNQCLGPSSTGQCLGAAGTTPATAFRAGIDGSTVPLPAVAQTVTSPMIPGVSGFPGANAAYTTSSYHIDPQYRPAPNSQYDITIQRELSRNSLLEVGYIGRTASHLFSSYQLNQVPFFMVYGGQSFAQAFDNLAALIQQGAAITPQPFFEAALAGSAFCKSYANCTAAVVANYGGSISTQRVRDLWNGIQNSFVFGPATAATNQLSSFFYYNSQGKSSYNAGFVSFRQRFSQNFTLHANFTYSHSLDETGHNQTSDAAFSNSFNPRYDWGNSIFDRKFVFNVLGLFPLPFGKGQGFVQKLAAGWSVSPIFAWYSGLPLKVADGSGQEFGQLTANAAGAILIQPNTFGNSIHSGISSGSPAPQVATAGNASTGGTGLNLFASPGAVFNAFRPVRPSQDTTNGGSGQIRGMARWNLDFTLARKFKVTERVNTSFTAQFFNAFNHVQFNDPSVNLQSPQSFGVITSQLNAPRVIVLGLHIDF